jgi:hypothetical protein
MDEAAMWCSMRTVSSKDDEETEDIAVARACPGGGNGGQHDDVLCTSGWRRKASRMEK